ncbi:hypothetical protein P5673_029100 [Acropora cervicornis]|uniref:Uncharacterized protein n=1 Tax=Acropora cervicornis TaxID=6130 RepID=A0AAD9PWF5_ACRCE|nr:hypothetical protein P5673_029100 [Acropora cervicornis]
MKCEAYRVNTEPLTCWLASLLRKQGEVKIMKKLRCRCLAPRSSSGARYQKVTTTGSKSARGFNGALKSLAKPISAARITQHKACTEMMPGEGSVIAIIRSGGDIYKME